MNEEAEFRPVTPYGRSKVLVEQDVAKLADSSFSPTFLRNATAYGVSPRLRFDLVLNNLVAWACDHRTNLYQERRHSLAADRAYRRHLPRFCCHVECPEELIHCEAFNVGTTQENYQIRDLAEIVNEIVPGCRIEYAKDGGPDTRCYRVDFSKFANVFPDFKPHWTARKGAEELYEAIRAGPDCSWRISRGLATSASRHIQQLLSIGTPGCRFALA